VYEAWSGQEVKPHHEILFNVGNITGTAASILVGMKATTWAMSSVGPLRWTGVVGFGLSEGFDLYGFARTTQNIYEAAQDGWQWSDNTNLLGYTPFALKGASKVLAGARAARSPRAVSADVEVQDLGNTQISAGSKCFVAGTEILTTEGMKSIEDIRVGDWVIADDPTTLGEIESRVVTDTFVRRARGVVDLYVDGEVISTTGEHPFWTPDRGWVEAKDLAVGSLLQTEDGRVIDVDRVEKREGDFTVYNFRVEGFHTYYVSDLSVLVHNAGFDYGKHLRSIKGNPPPDMYDPHAHHVLYKKGRGVEQQELVEEGQQILRNAGIDPLFGPENLVWAPNRVSGQHTVQDARDIVDTLRTIQATGGGADEMTEALEQFAQRAAQR
jgi:hypothetical protein